MTTYFFSKITLKYHPDLWDFINDRSLSDAYLDHQLIWKLFPGCEDEQQSINKQRMFVFRSDGTVLKDKVFYVVSAIPPQANNYTIVETKQYSPALQTQQLLMFKLRVNPVITITKDNKSLRHDVIMHYKTMAEKTISLEDYTKEWLLNRQNALGIEIDSESLYTSNYQQHSLKSKGRIIKYSSLDYTGLCTVKNPDEFLPYLFNGFGHSKAFGCGLWLIKNI